MIFRNYKTHPNVLPEAFLPELCCDGIQQQQQQQQPFILTRLFFPVYWG